VFSFTILWPNAEVLENSEKQSDEDDDGGYDSSGEGFALNTKAERRRSEAIAMRTGFACARLMCRDQRMMRSAG
jgi:hypothetical protein